MSRNEGTLILIEKMYSQKKKLRKQKKKLFSSEDAEGIFYGVFSNF